MLINKICENCKKSFSVPHWRAIARFCCRSCSDVFPRSEHNQTCGVCTKSFHLNPATLKNVPKRTLGVFCSYSCAAIAKSVAYMGANNPNYKNKNTDSDGYRICPPAASHLLGLKHIKLHQAVCFEILGLTTTPFGFHIHHRDCNILNNAPANLVLLEISDHKWLHKQFGIATLWAFCHEKIALDELISWSDNSERAFRLLTLTVEKQAENGQFGNSSSIVLEPMEKDLFDNLTKD